MIYIKSNFQKESGRIVVLMLLCLFAAGLEKNPLSWLLQNSMERWHTGQETIRFWWYRNRITLRYG